MSPIPGAISTMESPQTTPIYRPTAGTSAALTPSSTNPAVVDQPKNPTTNTKNATNMLKQQTQSKCRNSEAGKNSSSSTSIERSAANYSGPQKQVAASACDLKKENKHNNATIKPTAKSEAVGKNSGTTNNSSNNSNNNSANNNNNNNSNNNKNNNTDIKNNCDQSVAIKSEESTEQNVVNSSSDDGEKKVESGDSSENQILSRPNPVLLSTLNLHIVCNLCNGYLIDATTIVECLHSFCHSCLIKHLRTEQYCPRCEMMINTAKPNIKPDTTLQAIVYKLVPSLYEKELMRKRAFYKDRPEEAALATPEQRGDDTEHLIFSPSDYMSLSLEYADVNKHARSNNNYSELLRPRYLQCPSMSTVAHLKKFVHGKFAIDVNRFSIDIMYKVKTIVLLDHYTLMDIAYIYTWKRDAPMRFYFRVKESLKPRVRVPKPVVPIAKAEVVVQKEESKSSPAAPEAMTIIHEPTPSISLSESLLQPTEIKVEQDAEMTAEVPPTSPEIKNYEILPQSMTTTKLSGPKDVQSNVDKLKITLVSKHSKDKSANAESKTSAQSKSSKMKNESHNSSVSEPREERKVENIKLKIDLSKQNSVTIINMSDPQRKEITKSVRPEKEWKVKTKKEKDVSSKSSGTSADRKSKSLSPLTVPPITIKAERISPLTKFNQHSPESSSPKRANKEEEEKSQFLKSFALTPTKDIKAESTGKQTSPKALSASVSVKKELLKPTPSFPFKSLVPSKRKSKEPMKAITKKPKLDPLAISLPIDDFKIKLPPPTARQSALPAKAHSTAERPLMPPPAPLSMMRPPIGLLKKAQKQSQNKLAPPGSLTPRPTHGHSVQMAAPGNRTPIAKRYQPILPKESRPNPFANIPSDVNKLLKDAGTEIKSIGKNTSSSKVYGPKTESTLMGPPPSPLPKTQSPAMPTSSSNRPSATSTASRPSNSSKPSNPNNYLNLALFNSSKSKGKEAPPGCRTPIYTPNSPIYSPSSPQYVPNYNIPTVPTYKYTPKPSSSSNSYLQNVLGANSQLSSLFPTPPVKKDSPPMQSAKNSEKCESQNKRGYPFTRSPSPIEDPPEKQLKVKSLLTSCNINIPSSLSITITREDSESQSNSASYPKHKSPVNNYIEILKLPDQTAESAEHNKRQSPPMHRPGPSQSPQSHRKESADMHPKAAPHMSSQKLNMPTSTTPNVNQKPISLTNGTGHNKTPPNAQNFNVANAIGKAKAPSSMPTPHNMTKSATAGSTVQSKPLPLTAVKTAESKPAAQADKKTPSPEKRASTHSISPNDNTKSPKSPVNDNTAQAGKKFRPILPRQNPTPIPEVVPPKVTTANIIGTYSSPSGVAVKVHAKKKELSTKKSPTAPMLPPKTPAHGTVTPPQGSPKNTPKATSSSKSPANMNNYSAGKSPKTATPPPTNAAPANASMPSLAHPLQAMPYNPRITPPSQAEIMKFLEDKGLTMPLPHPYSSAAMYKLQQAYILNQMQRIQYAEMLEYNRMMNEMSAASPKATPSPNSGTAKGSSIPKTK